MSYRQRASGSRQSPDKTGSKSTPRGVETQLFAEGLGLLGGIPERTQSKNRNDELMRAPPTTKSVATPRRKKRSEPQLASQQLSNTGIPIDDGGGLSGVGGQNDWSISQEPEEESLPPARYNISPVQPSHSQDDDAIPGLSENDVVSMAAPSSPNPIRQPQPSQPDESPELSTPSPSRGRGRGRGRSSQPTVSHQIPRHLTLPPLKIGAASSSKTTHRQRAARRQEESGNASRTTGPALAQGLLPDQALPETPTRSQDGDHLSRSSQRTSRSRSSRRAGSYDPDDNRVNWTAPPNPRNVTRDRSRELSGPVFTPSRPVVRRRPSDESDSDEDSKELSVEQMLRSSSEREREGSAVFSNISDPSRMHRYGGYPTSGEEISDIPLGQAKPRVLVSNSSSGTNLGFPYSQVPGLTDLLDSSNTVPRNQTSAENSGSKKSRPQRLSGRGKALPTHDSWESLETGGDRSVNSKTFPPNQEALRGRIEEESPGAVDENHAINDISEDRRQYLEDLGFRTPTTRSHDLPDTNQTGGGISANGGSASTSGLDSIYKSQIYGLRFEQEKADAEKRAEERARAEGRTPASGRADDRDRLFRMPPGYRDEDDEERGGLRTPRPSGKSLQKGYTPAKPYVPPPFFTRDTEVRREPAREEQAPDNSYIAGDSGIDNGRLWSPLDEPQSPKQRIIDLTRGSEEVQNVDNNDDEGEVIPETQFSADLRPSSPDAQVIPDSQAPPEPRVLVPATASVASDLFERRSPVEEEEQYGHSSLKYPFSDFSQQNATQGDNGLASPSRMASFVAPSVAEEELLGQSATRERNRIEESPEIPLLSASVRPPIESFEMPSPPPAPGPISTRSGEETRKRKRKARDEGPEEEVSPRKKSRHFSPAPTPSRSQRPSPTKTPSRGAPLPRVGRTLVAASSSPETPEEQSTQQSPSPKRKQAGAIFSSSPLSAVGGDDSPIREVGSTSASRRTGGKTRGRKVTRGRSVSSFVRADPDTLASQDPFKALAQTSNKPVTRRAHTRSQSEFHEEQDDGPATSVPAKLSGKRTRQEANLDDDNSDVQEVFPTRSSHSKQKRTQLGRSQQSRAKPASHRTRAQTAALSSQSTSGGRSQIARRKNYVFALQAKHGKHYVPALVVETWEEVPETGTSGSDGPTTMCRLKFEDGSVVDSPLDLVYRCELAEGDELLIPGKKGGRLGRKGNVVNVESWSEGGQITVQPELTSRKGIKKFSAAEIAISLDAVGTKKWEGRQVTSVEEINEEPHDSQEIDVEEIDMETRKTKRRPRFATSVDESYPTQSSGAPRGSKAPPQTSEQERPRKRTRTIPSTSTPSAANKPLSGCAFIVALSITNEKGKRVSDATRNASKTDIQKLIKGLGGRIVEEDFSGLIRYGGSFSDDGNRWIWNTGDMEFVDNMSQSKKRKGKSTPNSRARSAEPLFLIADRTNRTVKYMTALAMGIPCVHKNWIESGAIYPWSAYLLPAGDCHLLGLPCSQMIRPDWMQHPVSLQETLEESDDIRKPLKEKSILFVYPSRKGSQIEEDTFDNQYFFACLATLIGASRVEVVHDRKHASLATKNYDVIVYENELLPSRATAGSDSTLTVESNWVSDCVISGCFFNHP